MASFLITANDTMYCNISRFLKQRPRHSGHFWSGEKLVALACSFCVSADTIIESYTGPVQDKRTLWIGLLFAILLLVCVACPFDGNIMVGIAWCVIFPLPVDLPMSVSVVIAEPLIVLSYQRTWCGITLAIVVTASRTAQLAWQQGLPDRLNIKGMASVLPWIVMPSLACVGIGLLLNWHHREGQRESEARNRAKSLELAARLHDATTNDLSYLIMSIDRLMSENPSQGDSMGLPQLREVARRALDQTHDVIAILSSRDTEASRTEEFRQHVVGEGVVTDRIGQFSVEVERHRRKIAALGFQGEVIVTDPSDLLNRLDEGTAQLVRSLLEETFANIAKHADCKQGYVFAMQVRPDGLYMSVADVSADEVIDGSTGSAKTLGMGFGLSHLRRMIGQKGGWLRTREEDGYWSCLAYIPIYHRDTT